MEGTCPRAPAPCRRQGLLAWALLALLLLLQGALFQRRLERELAGAIPRGYDQAAFLSASYRVYDVVESQGLVAGLRFSLALPVPNGWLLHTHGALLCCLL